MTKSLLIACALLASASVHAAPVAKKAPKATLSAELMSGHIDALKQSITLTSDSAGVWTVEVQKDCESYPCAVEDITTRTKTKVVSMMDARAGDGPLEIEFSNGMKLHQRATGWPPPTGRVKGPDFTLDMTVNGKVMTLPLYLSSYIKTNTYE